MRTIEFGTQMCGSLEESSKREWLLTDGLGGYAMGTVAGLRTRRYHGLLVVAAADGPASRMLGLVALEPVLVVGDTRIRLSTDEWAGGTVDPRGNELLARFDLENGLPRWRWQIADVVLERELAMTRGRPGIGIVHRLLRADRPVRLELTALCSWRNVHAERFAFGAPATEHTADGFVFEDAYRLVGSGWTPGGDWFRGVRAREEAARGLNDVEDVWAAGAFGADLTPGSFHEVTAAAAPFEGALPSASAIVQEARARAARLVAQAHATNELDAQLVLAADQFVIERGGAPTAVAGYPWFGEWSRDLMTSFDGLFLATGRAAEGRQLLRAAATTVSEGMLANTADTGTLEYNTVDGTLWFVHALGRYLEFTGDVDLGAELMPVLSRIVQKHVDGTRFGIGLDPNDGLLNQGADGWALTWMDARIDGTPVTPRIGKPVEVNALWLRALEVVERLGGDGGPATGLAAQCRQSFRKRFVRRDGLGLYDVVDGPAGDDASIRPNQLLAVSLPQVPLLDDETSRRVLDACRDALLTPLGLRSLAPDDPAFRPHHRGSPAERDAAYHQGTVWPWLIGPYVESCRRTRIDATGVLDGLEAHLGEWGLGSVSETADGAPPHIATGCPFQAWSVAELLRARGLLATTGGKADRRRARARRPSAPAVSPAQTAR
jgi:predicted glycogen debranching enzyme